VLEQGFDGNGNLTSLTPPGQPAHIFNYNSVDKETQYTPPDLAGVTTPQTIYDYDRDRKLTSITRPDSQVITFNYRLNTDQLTSLSIPTGDYTFGYDTNQELTSITAPSGAGLAFTLDGALQTKANWTGDIVGEVEIVLDNQFKIAEQKVNGANSILLGYDNDNLLTSAGSLTITRNADNGLITGSSQTNVSTSQSYNSYAEVLNYNATYNASQLYNVDYTRDNLGRITQQIETIEGVTQTLDYDYDLAGRLIQVRTNGVETESYDYDDNGNRTHVNGVLTATYDAQDRLLSHGDFVYTYTDNGELLTKTDISNNEVTSYVYDVIGNLVEVNLPDTTKIEYVIDGLNRRVGKKVNGTLVKGWLYQDQLNPVAELDGNNNITARFVYGDKINVPSYMEKGGQTYRIISDHLGSPRLIVNVATGVVEQRIDFDTWGNVSQDTNSELQPFGFAGGLYEAQTGLTRFGARDYDGAIGRWTSKDPIRFNGGDSNLFGYVGENPVNYIDPNGLVRWNGSMHSRGFVAGLGLMWINFELTSECVNGVQVSVEVTGIGPAAGFGLKVSETHGTISFEDHKDYISPAGLEGGFGSVSGSGVIFGEGGTIGKIRIGDAYSRGGTVTGGVDVGVTVGIGTSTITSEPIILECECGK